MKRTILLIILLIMVQGCATIRTLAPEGDHIEISHKGHKSYCQSIPRIYSGTFYNICKMNGEPNYDASTESTEAAFQYIMLDSLFSLCLDTVVIPYTMTRQITDGSIRVEPRVGRAKYLK